MIKCDKLFIKTHDIQDPRGMKGTQLWTFNDLSAFL